MKNTKNKANLPAGTWACGEVRFPLLQALYRPVQDLLERVAPKKARSIGKRLYGASYRRYYGPKSTGGRRVVIVSATLALTGGSIVATYAAEALRARGFEVLMVVPAFVPALQEKLAAKGVQVCECPYLLKRPVEDWSWLADYDFAIVNVFQNIDAAVRLSKILPTIWWIHECSDRTTGFYSEYRARFPEHDDIEVLRPIATYGVSRVAARAFEEFYPGCVDGLLPFGIPDERIVTDGAASAVDRRADGAVVAPSARPLTFAVIGGVCPRKGQLLFTEVYDRVRTADTHALVIGGYSEDDEYSREVLARAATVDSLELTGLMDREQLAHAFADIDVVVCASTEECLHTVSIETLMQGRVLITADNNGVADFIENGVNGFVYKTGDEDALAEIMRYVIEHRTELADIGHRARVTYEQHFSMDSFAERLMALIAEHTAKK